jgi:hypothetical protein
MNHPERTVFKARGYLAQGERFFYCRYEPKIFFTASECVAPDITSVVFMSTWEENTIQGLVNIEGLKSFESETMITPTHKYSDFIEIDSQDSSLWDE